MVSKQDTELYRQDARLRGAKLSVAERERLLKPYLPDPNSLTSSATQTRRQNSTKTRTNARKVKKTPIRTFLKSNLHQLVYACIHLFFGLYIRISHSINAVIDRILAIIYYHHRTPELIQKDVRGLSRLPEHLSVLLTLRREDEALQRLMDEVAELVAWSSCAGIPTLSVYEKSGILKSCIPLLYKTIIAKLSSYYGSPSLQPSLRLFAPHHSVYCPSAGESAVRRANKDTITVLLLSESDGRDTLVDLTKTLAEMSQNGKLSPEDITAELIDAEISEITSHPSQSTPASQDFEATTPNANALIFHPVKPEPDLLLVFGPYVKLDGYPPWQIRLTEIFCTGGKAGNLAGGVDEGLAVEYQGFLRGLWRYARAQMRFGR